MFSVLFIYIIMYRGVFFHFVLFYFSKKKEKQHIELQQTPFWFVFFFPLSLILLSWYQCLFQQKSQNISFGRT